MAAVCDGRQLTYAELERRANQLALHLRARGVVRGSTVGLLAPRGLDVYVGMLGILKAGAAYVPLDCEYPPDRVRYILDDCKASAVVTTSPMADKHELDGRGPVLLDRDGALIDRLPPGRLRADEVQAQPADLCYVIYTSGSTGKPKGVQIEHRAATHLVLAERVIYGVEPTDRVFHGFSVAFDASVEEIWMAFASGATLVVGTSEMVHAGPALTEMLAQAGVTVWSTVPTLLSVMTQDVPTLRLLILGGESCPADLVRRWYRPTRRMFNTYGPTEATVIATYALCDPTQPVTIGKPLPNYRTYVLDGALQPVPVGVAGELCIAGVGLARGYLGRPDLTATAFVDDPFADGDAFKRLYRTGDLARFAPDGNIEYLGRIDSQVKIRGFRVELAEIESVLMQHPDIQTAAVAVRKDQENEPLVGYVIPRAGQAVDEDAVRLWLRTRLPVYMIPALIEAVDSLPTLSSGKVDRKSLPAPRPRASRQRAAADAPRGPLEERIVAVWQELLAPLPVSRTDDFFVDLGGHSLLAARMVSQLRKEEDFADLSVLDVYNFATPAALAAELEARHKAHAASAPAAPAATVRPTTRLGYCLCVAAQTVSLFFVAGLFSMQWLTPYLVYCALIERGTEVVDAIAMSLAVLLAFFPVLMAASIAIKWAVIGRFKAGVYPVWGSYYFRWWFVSQVLAVVPIDYMAGTPLLAWYYRLMGARVGKGVFFGTDNISAFDLVSVGDDSCIGIETMLMGYCLEDGLLRLGPVSVGKRCFIGSRAVVRPGTVMEDDARLEDLSLLPEGGRIPRGQTWIGSPARPTESGVGRGADILSASSAGVPPAETYDHGKTAGETPAPRAGETPTPRPTPAAKPGMVKKAIHGLLYSLGVLLVPAVYLVALFPGLIWLNYASREYGGYWFLLLAPAVAIAFVVLMGLEIALVKWLLLGRVRPGRYSVHSSFYLRKWFFDQLMDLSLDLLGPLYSTLYLAPWLRLLGAKLGHHAEVSTASATSPDLLTIGDESFIADAVCLGASRVEAGWITIAPTSVGKRAFVGNSAFVPAGAAIGDEVLIGCMSAPPRVAADALRKGTSWLGSPSFFLPKRQESVAFSADQTFKPTRKLIAMRLFIEFFRVTLPTTCFVALTSFLITRIIDLQQVLTPIGLVIAFPVLYVGFGVLAALVVVASKWLLMGRYRPGERPLWSSFVWRTELITAMHEHLADPFLVLLLVGTPWVSWFFRLMGAKVGRRVVMETTYLTEFDLISIGDRAVLGSECTIQTHLFEDRVMKMSTIDIGDGCTVGAGSIVLYDTIMESGSSLGDLSLLMKGENLPAHTRWEGTPARLLGAGCRGHGVCDHETLERGRQHRGHGTQVAPEISFLFGLDQPHAHLAGPWVWVLDLNHHGGEERTSKPNDGLRVPPERLPGRELTRQVVGKHLDLEPHEVVLDVDAQRGLLLAVDKMPACPRATALRVNVAHSENTLVAGVSFAGPIGVDVEVMRPGLDLPALAREHLTAGEWQQVQALPSGEQTIGFYKLWTAKEAFVKAIRQGLFFGLDQVELSLDRDGSVRLERVNGRQELARGWRITHRLFEVDGTPAVAAAATGD